MALLLYMLKTIPLFWLWVEDLVGQMVVWIVLIQLKYGMQQVRLGEWLQWNFRNLEFILEFSLCPLDYCVLKVLYVLFIWVLQQIK